MVLLFGTGDKSLIALILSTKIDGDSQQKPELDNYEFGITNQEFEITTQEFGIVNYRFG